MPKALATFAALLALPLAPACGPGPEPRERDAGPADFTGIFQVDGYTVVRRSEESRPIRGTVIIALREAGHVVTFDLKTEVSSPEGPIEAEMIGSADASVAEGALSGEAETQILMGTVPGIDPTFPYVPARLGARIVSGFRMTPDEEDADGFRIEIETEGAEGERYDATRTVLRAVRSADADPSTLGSADEEAFDEG